MSGTNGAPPTPDRGQGGRQTDRAIVESLGTVGRAFFGRFIELRDVQRRAMPLILRGKNLLVASATASGKTEAVIAPLVARVASDGERSETTRVLVIAPTRALVNDLYRRIKGPLDRVALSCGRQTSDHRDKFSKPFVLVTTPESFDSMLVRDGVWRHGRLEDHLLAHVEAVFIDEAHMFDGNPRGDQVPWLLGRLRRLRGIRDQANRTPIQICAASATVSNPESLANRLLCDGAEAVRVAGVRDIEVLGPSSDARWQPLSASLDADAIRNLLEVVPSQDFVRRAGEQLASALRGAGDQPARKILVFVPTRQLADSLSADWHPILYRHRQLAVLAHHGSLSKNRREEAERRFLAAPDAVLVATTTLEVGIDIGGVDVVGLVGAPPDTRALLQRIGRGGRRVGRTRLLALPRNGAEQAALASMLQAARDGQLEPESYARRWSVFVQQTASFVAQQRNRGRLHQDLLELAHDVWPEEPPTSAETITDGLLADAHLHEARGRLFLGDQWSDRFTTRGMHANIDSEAPGVPVVNASTGEEIARVNRPPDPRRGVVLAGQTWNVQGVLKDEIRLASRRSGRGRQAFEYSTRKGPTGREYAVHVSRGLGFAPNDAPLLEDAEGALWFHFGGSAYELLLRSLLGDLDAIRRLSGLALRGVPDLERLRELASDRRFAETVRTLHEELEKLLNVGPYQRLLPADVRRKVVADLLDPRAFRRWLDTRKVWTLALDDPRRRLVDTL